MNDKTIVIFPTDIKTIDILNYDKLQSNWNSLREWITNENNKYHYGLRSGKTLLYGKFLGRVDVLDKMNELESGEKEWKNF